MSEQPGSGRRTSDQSRIILMLAVAVGIISVGGVGYLALGTVLSKEPSPPVKSSEVVLTEVESSVETGDRDLPIAFMESDASEGLAFSASRSRLSVYPNSAYYRLWGSFEVTGDLEVERIDVRLELVDESGAAVVTDSFEAWSGHEATLRRGDRGVFEKMLKASAEVQSGRLAVMLTEKTPASGPYPESQLLEPTFALSPPEHLKLEIRERAAVFSQTQFMDGGYFKAQWEFHNAGTSPIRTLKYEVQLLDEAGELLEVSRKLATFSSHPPIGAGETVLESEIEQVSEDYDDYRLVITEIE